MRFDAIHLPAYGPFTDASLDLSQGRGKLEVVYGLNEAGKSSLLRAISDFLFGVPGQTHDNFLHPYGSLRIRALIERGGERIECVRRKANVKSLRAADDEEPVSEELFRTFVPIENRDVFQQMFGLDAGRLRQGGEELLKGQSEFGQLLFSAAAGVEGLHDVLKNLNDEADKLFKPKATTTKIAKILEQLKESKDRLREAQVSLTDWNKLQEDHQRATAQSAGLDAGILRKQSEAQRLKRIQGSLGLLRRRGEIREQLAAVETARILRDGFAGDHQTAASEVVVKTNEVRDTARRVEELRKEVEAIVLPEDLLAREQATLALHTQIGGRSGAAGDRQSLHRGLRQADLEITHLLLSLGEPPQLDRVPGLVVRAADKRLVPDLSTARARLETEVRNGQDSLALEQRKLEQARRQLEGLPATKPLASLRAAIQNALQAAGSEGKAGGLETGAAEESRKIGADAKALPWPSTLEALDRGSLPTGELVTEWTGRLERAEDAVEQAKKLLRDAQAEVSRREKALATLQAGRWAPSLAQLTEDRKRRDLGWKAVRRSWLESDTDSAEMRDFLQQPGDSLTLARAYEASVVKSDDSADRLRTQADHVAKLEQERIAIDMARQEAAARGADLEEAQARRRQLQAEWEALWTPFRVTASAPRQMAAWLQRRASILSRLRAVEEKRTQAGELLAEAERATHQLQLCLSEIGETRTPASNSVAGWRSLAEQIVESQQNLARQREKLADQIEESEKLLAAAQARVGQASTGLDDWKEKWAAVMTSLGLPVGTEPPAAQEVIRVRDEMLTRFREAQALRIRIAGIDRDEKMFLEQVHQVLESVAPDLLSTPELEAVGELHQRLSRAKQQRDFRETKNKDLEKERKGLDKAERDLKQAQSRLAALAGEARCDDPECLPVLIAESARRKELEKRLEETEEQLGAISAGRSVAALEAEAQGVEPDQVPGQLEAIERDLEESKSLLKTAEKERITLENDLKRMEDKSDACAAGADIEAHKAEALEAAEQYVRLQLARIVLQGAVEQYREKTQGDMLKRSSELFSLLSAASFAGLKLDWDDAGQVALAGVRAHSGAHVRLDGMSDGTRDQLYLALRLASMELYASEHEPIPFIADDILVNFDNPRAAAAIHALAELAKHTQVLLFTHHQHLVDLTRANLPASRLAVCEISCQIGSVRVAGAG